MCARALCRLCAILVLTACEAPDGGAPWLEERGAAGVAMERRLPEGYEHLAARLGGGVCVIDADGSPPLDLFFADRAGGSRLFVAREPWRYEDRTAELGLLDAGDAIGCLALDADADGDTDLLVTGVGTLRLFLREGDRFADASTRLGASVAPRAVLTSAAAGDVDADGDVDIVVAGFVDVQSVPSGDCGGLPCAVLIGAQPALPNLVLLREGAGFRPLADAGPLAEREPTLAIGICDVDGDGRTEVYVGNDAGDVVRDRVVRWEGGSPVDVSEHVGMAHDAHGHGIDTMGWSAGDVNGDLRLDHAVTPFEGFHSPIFVCGSDGFCEDRGRELGTSAAAQTVRWGNALVDLDLDGDLDLVEAAGHVFTEREGEAIGLAIEHAERPILLANDRGRFAAHEPIDRAYEARGLAVADLDDDGRPDVVLTTARSGPVLLRNVRRPRGRWLRILLRGRAPNTDAIGARVVVRTGGQAVVRERIAGEGFLGSFDPRLLVGVPHDGPITVEVRWPSGRTERVEGLADREIVIAER